MNDMTTEQAKAYEAWWSDPATLTNTRACFVAGWNAHAATVANGREAAEQAARQIERAGLKRWLLHKATSAFLSGADDLGKLLRDMANTHL